MINEKVHDGGAIVGMLTGTILGIICYGVLWVMVNFQSLVN